MARPEGFEPPTLCLEGRRSFQLSYGRTVGELLQFTALGVSCATDNYSARSLILVPAALKNPSITRNAGRMANIVARRSNQLPGQCRFGERARMGQAPTVHPAEAGTERASETCGSTPDS